jgi:chromosome segregation ATPase
LKEQQFNQENLSKNLEDFKLKLTDQNQFYTEQRNQFEDAHSKLTHKIFHLERSEENMKLEIDEIKRKALQDSLVLTNKEEEIKDLNRKIEKLNETLRFSLFIKGYIIFYFRDKENLLSKKNDDLSNALKKADESRNEILNLK